VFVVLNYCPYYMTRLRATYQIGILLHELKKVGFVSYEMESL